MLEQIQFNLTLDISDYLKHQLYIASISPQIKQKRRRSWLMTALLFILSAFILRDNQVIFYYFVFFTIITIIFYPFYSRWRYKRHYQQYIQNNYKGKIGQSVQFTFLKTDILAIHKDSESRISNSALHSITELDTHFYLRLHTEETLIFPKEKIPDVALFNAYLNQVAEEYNIPKVEALNWQWR